MSESRQPLHVLMIEDSQDGKDYGPMARVVGKRLGIEVHSVRSRNLGSIGHVMHYFDMVLIDGDLEATTGAELAAAFNKIRPAMPFVLVCDNPRPWVNKADLTPNIRAVVTKWDGVDAMLEASLKALKPAG